MRLHGLGLWRLPTLIIDLVSVDILHDAIVLYHKGIEGNKEIFFHRAIPQNGIVADLFNGANLLPILAVHFHALADLPTLDIRAAASLARAQTQLVLALLVLVFDVQLVLHILHAVDRVGDIFRQPLFASAGDIAGQGHNAVVYPYVTRRTSR